jgi:hypothetical protein
MLMRCIAVALAIALIPQAAAAAAWPAYHIHHVSLNPTRVTTAKGLGYSTAPAGKVYLVVVFHEVNRDDVQSQIQYNEIKVVTPNGKLIDQSYSDPDNALTDLVLDPGGKGDGGVAWEIPRGIHAATLRWSPAPLFSNVRYPVYAWKVTF